MPRLILAIPPRFHAPLHLSFGFRCAVENTPYRYAADVEALRNLHGSEPFGCQRFHLIGLLTRRGFAAHVLAFSLSLGDAFALTLKHHLAFELSDVHQRVVNHAPGWRGCINAKVQDAKRHAFRFKLLLDLSVIQDRACEPVELRDNECVALPHESQRFLELGALRIDRRKLLPKDVLLFDARRLQIAELGFEPGVLIFGAGSRITYEHGCDFPLHGFTLLLVYTKHWFQKSTSHFYETHSSTSCLPVVLRATGGSSV